MDGFTVDGEYVVLARISLEFEILYKDSNTNARTQVREKAYSGDLNGYVRSYVLVVMRTMPMAIDIYTTSYYIYKLYYYY